MSENFTVRLTHRLDRIVSGLFSIENLLRGTLFAINNLDWYIKIDSQVASGRTHHIAGGTPATPTSYPLVSRSALPD